MYVGMQYEPIRPIKGEVKVTSPWKLEILQFLNAISPVIYNGSWQLATNS